MTGKWATFHDQLAQAAQRNGADARTYRRTARQYLNASWGVIVLGIVAGAIGSWQWSVVPCVLALFLWLQSSSDRAVAARLEEMEKTSPAP